MSKEKVWYVYMHTNKINNKKYIGITCLDRYWDRWRSDGSGYKNQVFGKAIKKYGWDNFNHEILKKVKTEAEAFELEKYYIKKYNSTNKDYGYNISIGGDSSNSGIYNLPSMSVPVYQYDLNGNFLAEYPSMMEAERQTGINNSAICACCKGTHNYTKNFIWSYEKHEKIDSVDPKQLRYELITKNQEKNVYQYDLNGNFIQSYKSLAEASKITNIDFKLISKCCLDDKIRQAYGYIWSYTYLEQVEPYDPYNKNKNIYKYDINGNLLNIYDNIDEAILKNDAKKQTLSKACKESNENNYTLHYGYIWSYKPVDDIHFKNLIEKIQESKKNKKTKKRSSEYSDNKIYQYSKGGNFIKEYKNIDDVINIFNLKYKARNSILACCNGKSKTSYGYQWRFVYSDKLDAIKKRKIEKSILKIDRNGNIIKEYENIFDVHNEYKHISFDNLSNNIFNCAKGNLKTFDGYIWIFKDELTQLNIKDRQKSYKKISVMQYDKNNNYLQTFDSIVEAQKHLGINDSHISECCSGKRKSAHGYIWKYAS